MGQNIVDTSDEAIQRELAIADNMAGFDESAPSPDSGAGVDPEHHEGPQPSTAEVLTPMIYGSLKIYAPNWEITVIESQQLGEAYGQCIDRYFPDTGLDGIMEKYGPLIMAATVTLQVFGSRQGVPRRAVTVEGEAEVQGGENGDAQ